MSPQIKIIWFDPYCFFMFTDDLKGLILPVSSLSGKNILSVCPFCFDLQSLYSCLSPPH